MITARSRRERISAITGVTDPSDLGAIESIMSIDRCLDGMSAHEFDLEAKIAWRVYTAMDEATRAWYRDEGRMVAGERRVS